MADKMTLKDKVEFILLQYPATKFNRYDFLLYYLTEFHLARYQDGNYIIPAIELRQFFADKETIERTLRAFLKEDKRFKLPQMANLKRKRLEKNFALNFGGNKIV